MEKDDDGAVSISELNGLIKQKRNDEIKAILVKQTSSYLTGIQNSTIMHTAVNFNNIKVIPLLFSFGFDINAQNSLGQTPLLLAAQNKSYQAVQLLLALDGDILIVDINGQNVLQVLLKEDKDVPAYLVEALFEILRTSKLEPCKIANELEKAGCSLERVISLNNAEVMKEMFVLQKNEIDGNLLRRLLHCAVYSRSIESVKGFFQNEPPGDHIWFFKEVKKNMLNKASRPLFKQLFVNGDFVDFDFVNLMRDAFNDEYDEFVEIFLDVNIDKYCREKFGWDLLVTLFGNKKLDVIELIKNRDFDVKSFDDFGNTALHNAASAGREKLVTYLLNNGADVNAKNVIGETPIFNVNAKILEILFEAGADIQMLSDDNTYPFTNNMTEIKELFYAYLMILKAQGQLQEHVRAYIYDDPENNEIITICNIHSKDLDWMKSRCISDSLSLFSVLTEKPEYLARYVKDRQIYTEIRNACRGRMLEPEYSHMLTKNMKRACEVNELRVKAAAFLSDKMQIADDNHLVIKIIIDFLTYKDLQVFNKIEEL